MTLDELISIVLDALKGCVQGDSVGSEERECDAETDKGKLLGSRGGSGFAVPRVGRRGNRAVCECSDPVDCLFERNERKRNGSGYMGLAEPKRICERNKKQAVLLTRHCFT